MMNKGLAAFVVIGFVGLIQAQDPPMWAVAALTIGLYETGLMTIRIARRAAHKERKRRYVTATRLDMRRVEKQVFNPIREVS